MLCGSYAFHVICIGVNLQLQNCTVPSMQCSVSFVCGRKAVSVHHIIGDMLLQFPCNYSESTVKNCCGDFRCKEVHCQCNLCQINCTFDPTPEHTSSNLASHRAIALRGWSGEGKAVLTLHCSTSSVQSTKYYCTVVYSSV